MTGVICGNFGYLFKKYCGKWPEIYELVQILGYLWLRAVFEFHIKTYEFVFFEDNLLYRT